MERLESEQDLCPTTPPRTPPPPPCDPGARWRIKATDPLDIALSIDPPPPGTRPPPPPPRRRGGPLAFLVPAFCACRD
jgi:hypothetical protein